MICRFGQCRLSHKDTLYLVDRVYWKCLGKHRGRVLHARIKKRASNKIWPQTPTFRFAAPTIAWHKSFRFFVFGSRKTVMNSTSIGNENSLHQRAFDSCQTIRNPPRTFDRVRQSMIRLVRVFIDWTVVLFYAFILNCDLINNKSLVIKYGTRICQLSFVSKILHS